MKVLVVGSGAREHCLIWKIAQSPMVDKIYCAPGNGGTQAIAENLDIAAENVNGLLEFALSNNIDLTVVGPEAPLVLGIVDAFKEKGLNIFGPSKELAKLEGSKVYAKQVMKKFNIPTSGFEVFNDPALAKEYLKTKEVPIVIKADGLAQGKGVMVLSTINEAFGTVELIMEEKAFGRAGDNIVVEDFLDGEEVSILFITDGQTVLPLLPSQDHKRAFDGDKGPNTGGMGAYAPAPLADGKVMAEVMDRIARPLIKGLADEGKIYQGILYVGLMIKDSSVSVLEFNIRLGDPETQAVLPLLKTDLVELMLKTVKGELAGTTLEWANMKSLCTVVASGGYPGDYKKQKPISGLDEFKDLADLLVFHAGTKLVDTSTTLSINPEQTTASEPGEVERVDTSTTLSINPEQTTASEPGEVERVDTSTTLSINPEQTTASEPGEVERVDTSTTLSINPEQTTASEPGEVERVDFDQGKRLETSGGRVLSVVGIGVTLKDAKEKVYKAIKNIKFEGMQYRNDIGNRAINKQ